jgi:hypothetical protein
MSRGCCLGGPQVGGIEFEDTNKLSIVPNFAPFRKKTRGDCTRPLLPSNPGVGRSASPKVVTYREGLVDTQHPDVLDSHPVVSAQRGGEDVFVFNDTIEGPRAPVVKPGRVTQA